MNWLQKTSQANHQELTSRNDFIGYHCQRSELFDGEIINDNNYATSHYLSILDSLPFDLRNNALSLLENQPTDEYDEKFEVWSQHVHDFLWKNGIRWIFVSTNVPLGGDFSSNIGAVYGDHCYYVFMPDAAIIDIINDVGVNDTAYAYLYDSRVGNPEMVPIPESQEFY